MSAHSRQSESHIIHLDGCALLTPEGARYFEAVERERDKALDMAERARREFFDCEGRCELDCDGHGGRATHCRRCPHHPLRKGDPAEAIARYLHA